MDEKQSHILFDPVLQNIEPARAFGFRQLANGAKLFGHVPHVVPEAWLHQIYAPLAENDVVSLEKNMLLTIPTHFREFLHLANGVGLFSGALSIYGKRTSYVRSGDEAWQPFCLATANTLDRPAHGKPWHIVVGSYRSNGSLVFLDAKDGTAFRTKAGSKKILNRWQDFWTMLTAETGRLAGLFDAQGHKLSEGPTTPPLDM